ncbi:MAG: hypothetical protein WCT19_00625 [Candidatus Paceibacterota bacterium]
MKQVPESKVKVSKEAQVAELLKTLAGNKVFGLCRGNMPGVLRDSRGLMYKAESPSQFLKLLNQHFADCRVMLKLLAKYQRDGWKEAEHQLETALGEDFVIDGEDFSIQETTPATILMLEPEITLLMISWSLTHEIDDLATFVKGNCAESLDPVLFRLFEEFPTLNERTKDWAEYGYHRNWQGIDLFSNSYGDRFEKDLDALKNQKGEIIPLRLTEHQQNSALSNRAQRFGYLFIDKDQSEILSQFGRADQMNLTTWQLHVPTLIVREILSTSLTGHFFVGLHPEKEHSVWQKKWPAFASRGFAHGFGATLMHNDYTKSCTNENLSSVYKRCFYGRLPSDGVLRIMFDIPGYDER